MWNEGVMDMVFGLYLIATGIECDGMSNAIVSIWMDAKDACMYK